MLMYSTLFGLEEMELLPRTVAPGTCAKSDAYYDPVSGVIGGGKWSKLIRTSIGRQGSELRWVDISVDQLPAKAKTEALLLGITL